MPESEAAQEPTMEEILASIRRIISEDDSGAQTAEALAEEDGEHQEEVPEEGEYEEYAPAEDVGQVPTPRETSNPDEEQYASVTSVFQDDQNPDAYEETESVEEEQYEPEQEYVPASQFQQPGQQQSGYAAPRETYAAQAEDYSEGDYGDEDFSPQEPVSPAFSDTEPFVQTSVPPSTHGATFESAVEAAVQDELLSPQTQSQVASMLGQLNPDAAVSQTPAGQSLEGLVRDMLRPMLHHWLDANLPAIVERMVEREIKRVSGPR